jgi:hypothetical protein
MKEKTLSIKLTLLEYRLLQEAITSGIEYREKHHNCYDDN